MGRTNTAGVKGCAGQLRPVLCFFLIFPLFVGLFLIRESARAQVDVSNQIEINYANSLYDRRAGITSYDATLTNTGGDSISAPIKVIIEGISSGQVSVANPDGTTTDGKPYFDHSNFLGDEALDSQETSQAKKWKFYNPTRIRFTVQTLVLGGEEEYGPPDIAITNPVDDGIIADATPFITLLFNDTESGIDTNSFEIEINGVNSTSLFDVSGTGASCQYDAGLPQGINVISATISNNHGISNSASATFNVATSAEENLYVFSLEENPWLFISPGDGTYAEYLSPQDLGVDGTDITSLAMSGSGNHYFNQPGGSQILQSMGGGTNSLYLTYAQLGLVNSQLDALHLMLNGSIIFSLLDQQDLYYSTGNNSNSLFITDNDLGVPGQEVSALHIGYDGLIYFAVPSDASEDGVAIYQSAGDGICSLFLTSGDLGVPGSEIDAFAMVPDIDAPSIAITSPTEGTFLNTITPAITVVFSDDYAGIDTSSFNMAINGIDYTDQCTVTDTGADCQVTSGLPVGSNTAVAAISDLAGNQASDSSTFQIGVIRAIPGATPTSGPSPLTVHFTTDGEDPAGTIVVFRWDFDGDGSWDTYDTVARDYNHTYYTAGTYASTLYVLSSTGETATASITITVQNNPPVVTADAVPSNGEVPLTVNLYGSGSDPDGSIVLYEWDFDGDGTYDWSSTTTGNTSYTYNTVGTYQAVFRITDDTGLTATAIAYTTVIEANPPGSPTATASASPTEGEAPLAVSFNGIGTDPDNDIVLYEWDFDGDGTYDWSSTSSGSTTHTYTEAGLHVARFRVTDSMALTGSDQIGIYVTLAVSLSVTNDTAGIIMDKLNLTGMTGVAVTASSTYEYCYTSYPVSNVRDGYEESYWMSVPGDTPNQGADTYAETVFANPRVVNQVNIKGGYNYDYYGITHARLEFFDDADNLLHSTEEYLSQDAQVMVGLLENVKRFRLTALAANDWGGLYDQVSIGEIEIFDDKSFTAAASSIYDPAYPDWCKVENLFDPNESWYSAYGDHPDAGTNPWVEVNFTEAQKVSRIVVDQSWDYGWSGVTRAKIELLDESGIVLFESEYDLLAYLEVIDLPDIEDVVIFRLLVLSADNPYSDPNNAYVSIYGLDILTEIDGEYVSLVQKSDQGTYAGSSEWKTDCYTNYPATNLIDGNSETIWLSAENDTPNYGVNPFVEITFPSAQTVSQITISGGSWYSYYGITRAKIELLDIDATVLYSGEYDLEYVSDIAIPDVTEVSKCRLTALESSAYYDYYCSWGDIGIYQKLDEPEPTTTDIMTTLSADTTVSVYIKDSEDNIIRTLAYNEFRQQGSYSDNWDLTDSNGFRATDGVYHAVFEYIDANGHLTTYDLSDSTGGTRNDFPIGAGCNTRAGDWTENFSPFDDEQVAFTFTLCSAQEVTAFIGPLWGGTDEARIRTIINRKPFPAGTHTIYWDGLDDNGNIAEAPPGDDLITGFWRYTLPDNAVFVTGGCPEITGVSADPNYFSPFSEKCDENGRGEGVIVNYTVSEDVSSVEFRVYSVETGSLLKRLVVANVQVGENAIFWDGKNNKGEYVDIGDYRVGLMAADAQGNESMFRYSLVRIDY